MNETQPGCPRVLERSLGWHKSNSKPSHWCPNHCLLGHSEGVTVSGHLILWEKLMESPKPELILSSPTSATPSWSAVLLGCDFVPLAFSWYFIALFNLLISLVFYYICLMYLSRLTGCSFLRKRNPAWLIFLHAYQPSKYMAQGREGVQGLGKTASQDFGPSSSDIDCQGLCRIVLDSHP